jgi:hypothetical protein
VAARRCWILCAGLALIAISARAQTTNASNGGPTVSAPTLRITATAGSGSFGAKTDFATGAVPNWVALGDVNGDGQPDVAVANRAANTVSVRLGNGSGGFGAATDYATGTDAFSVALGDVSGDGRPDLVVANLVVSTVSVLLGNGSGGFGAKTDFATGAFPSSVVIGEVNGDGRPDLMTSNYSAGSVSVLLGDGVGGFGTKTDFATGLNPYSVAVRDVSGDGRADLAVANFTSNTVSVLLGNGAGGFGAKTDFTTGLNPYATALGDVNGDGRADLAVTNTGANTVSVWLGSGAGGFGVRTDYATGAFPVSLMIGDVNGDAIPDLAVANFNSNTASVLLGNGAGGFGAKSDFATAPGCVSLVHGDVSGDGTPDLVVANQTDNSLSVLLGLGGAIAPPGVTVLSPGASQVYAITPNTGFQILDVRVDGVSQGAIGSYAFGNVAANHTIVTAFQVSQIPSAASSTCPTSITGGPDGSCCFDVVVRNLAGDRLAGVSVVVQFGCPVSFCSAQPPGVTVNGAANTARVFTNDFGVAHICICLQSALASCTAAVYANGIALCGALSVVICPATVTCVPQQWNQVATNLPIGRHSAAMASDYDHEQVLLFGGATGALQAIMGDTWRWDGLVWTALSPLTSPAARAQHAMVYDRGRHKMVLFGGVNGSGWLGDTWEFDGANWALVATTGPSARSQHAMAYDNTRGRVVLFGGFDGALRGDTWEWDGTTWTQTATTGPTPRRDLAMCFDYSSDLTMLYGGLDVSGNRGDLWVYGGTGWYEVPMIGTTPGQRSRHAMAFSHEGDAPVLYGGTGSGADASTWRWSGGQWVRTIPGVGPRLSHSMAYDHYNDHLMLYGGSTSDLGDPLSDTQEWCSPCTDVAAVTDSLGQVQFPTGVDVSSWTEDEQEIDESNGDTSNLYPNSATSMDTWYPDMPCDPALGGETDEEDFADSWPEERDSLGFGTLTEAELADSLASWESQIELLSANEPGPFADSLAAAGPYSEPPKGHCPDPAFSYAFGGRDIIFVHGNRTTPLKDRMFGLADHDSVVDWIPTNGSPGYSANPSYYGINGSNYWKNGAINYWQRHIDRFLTARGYKNRYLIVAWPVTQRMEVGVVAVLTQIADAMRDGIGVVDLSGHNDTSKFGTPSFVVVSHSTGGPLVDVALSAAANQHSLKAEYIAAHAKAHVAVQGAFSGSRIATVAVGASAALVSTGLPGWCRMIQFFFGDHDGLCDHIVNWDTPIRGVTFDLVPLVMQLKWGRYINSTPTPAVTITGGHPSFAWPIKRLLLKGLDDGVVTTNSASANPNPWFAGPSGYLRLGPTKFASRRVKDLGINRRDDKVHTTKRRSKGYFKDQIKDPPDLPPELEPYLTRVASGCTDYLSPTGMVQPWHLWTFGGPLDPKNRYDKHYSFIEAAADHYGMTPNLIDEDFNANSEYRPSPALLYPDQANREEVRVLTSAEMHLPYTVGEDDSPLLDYTNPAVGSGLKVIETVKGKCFPKRKGQCKVWVWRRVYHRLADWENKLACDYAYDYLLTAHPDTCTFRSVGVSGLTNTFFARTARNPVVGEVRIEFGLPSASKVDIDVYDMQGRRVRQLLSHALDPGRHRVSWDRRTDSGGIARPGVYFWRLRLDGQDRAIQKAMLLQ